jgi:hypothetical protein
MIPSAEAHPVDVPVPPGLPLRAQGAGPRTRSQHALTNCWRASPPAIASRARRNHVPALSSEATCEQAAMCGPPAGGRIRSQQLSCLR